MDKKKMQSNPKLLAAGLTAAQIGQLYITGNREKFKAAEVIIQEGEAGASMFLLQEGSADVTDRHGKKVHTFRAGDMFGEASMLKGERRSATVTASGAVVCLEIDSETYQLVFDERAKAKLAETAEMTNAKAVAFEPEPWQSRPQWQWRPGMVDSALRKGRMVKRLERLSPIRAASAAAGVGDIVGMVSQAQMAQVWLCLSREFPPLLSLSFSEDGAFRCDIAQAMKDARAEAAAASASATELFQLAKLNQNSRRRRAAAAGRGDGRRKVEEDRQQLLQFQKDAANIEKTKRRCAPPELNVSTAAR